MVNEVIIDTEGQTLRVNPVTDLGSCVRTRWKAGYMID
jgi:hypothetical protein